MSNEKAAGFIQRKKISWQDFPGVLHAKWFIFLQENMILCGFSMTNHLKKTNCRIKTTY